MSYDAVLFDLDGTLVDSIHDIAQAANRSLIELDFAALEPHLITTFVGRGVDALIWQCLLECIDDPAPEPELYQRARALFARHYNERVQQGQTPVFDQVPEGLQAFKQAGYLMAVVTNKPLSYTHIILEHTGLADCFDLVVGGDSCEEKKPHPLPLQFACAQLEVSPQRALMIGDSINDVEAARQAGIDVLVLPYGYSPGQPVDELAAQAVVDDLMAAHEWAQRDMSS